MNNKDYFVHESSFIDEGVKIGNRTKIWYFCHVLEGTEIGTDCILGQNVMAGPNAKIGNGVKIQNNVSVYDGVILEDFVFCGPSMVFTNVINPRSHIERKHEYKTTLVKHHATLGANCTIVCGNVIGEYALVAAGAVVNKDVPAYAMVAGVPASIKGWFCECGNRISFIDNNGTCTSCSKKYQKISDESIILIG